MAIEIERKEHTAGDLRRLACRAASSAQARRMLAIALVLEGSDRTTAARSSGMDRQTLRDWVHRYNAEGIAGLVDRPRPGRPPRLSPVQVEALVEIVETGPDVAVDGVVRWRCVDLKGVVADRFAVALSERQVGRILNRQGYTRLKPRPQHPKADEAAQAAFKNVWPAPSARCFSMLPFQSAPTYPASEHRSPPRWSFARPGPHKPRGVVAPYFKPGFRSAV